MLKIIFELILSAKCLHKISNFEYFCVCYCDRYLFHTHTGSTITFSFLIMMMTMMMLAWRLVEEIELMFLPWWWKRIKIWPPRDDKNQSGSFLVIGKEPARILAKPVLEYNVTIWNNQKFIHNFFQQWPNGKKGHRP